jgi:sulfur-oxidizing protein SoxB
MEHLMDQTAITYPHTTLTEMTGAQIKSVLEDVCDNLFNPDPYYQQGGDMVRVGGLQYSCEPSATMGRRISGMRLNGRQIEADKRYKVAGWAAVSEESRDRGGEPIWDLMANYLRDKKTVPALRLNAPKLRGISSDSATSVSNTAA